MPERRIFEDISYAGRLTSKLRPGIIFDQGQDRFFQPKQLE